MENIQEKNSVNNLIIESSKKTGITQSIKLLWKCMQRKDKIWFILILLSSVIAACVQIFPSMALTAVIAKLSGEPVNLFAFSFLNSWGSIESILLLMGLCWIFWIIGMLIYMTIDIFARHLICIIHERAMEIVFQPRKNLDFNMTNGEVNYIIKNASDNVYDLFESLCWSVLTGVIASILIGIQIAFIDIVTFAVFIVVIIAVALCILLRIKLQHPIVARIEDHNAKIGNTLLKSIINVPLITILKSQIAEFLHLRKQNAKFYSEHKKRAFVGFIYWILVIFVEYIGLALIVYVALSRQMVSGIAISEIILIINYVNYCYGPVEQMGYLLPTMQQIAIKICNLFKLNVPLLKQDCLSENNNKLAGVKIEKISIKNMQVEIQDFSRRYSYDFYKGNLTTIRGKSGTGKTTFINAMCGLRDYKTGSIIINDKINVNSLGGTDNILSYAFQECMLFDRSVAENIYYPYITKTKKSETLIHRFALDEIMERDAENGDMLSSLSGGEKKRISLLRGLLQPAQVYIFDEPTNELDEQNVNVILKELKKLSKDKIVIVISHDSRVVNISDSIIDLDDEINEEE